MTIFVPYGMLIKQKEKGGVYLSVSDEVLQLLRESEETISGEEMAERLGISRNSVWKAVQKLRQAEYEIVATTNRGYHLVSESNVLSPENVRRYLSNSTGCVAINVRDKVSSTNTVLKELAEQGGREGMTIIAEHQEQGKGRLGRSFYSPRGSGLYMSVLLRPELYAEQSLAITTAAAVSVARAIDRMTGEEARIKWVNDVYLRGKKVCGILTEASLDFESGKLNYAVLGIGVNIQEPQSGFPGDLGNVAGGIFQGTPSKGARPRLAAEILNEFFNFYHELPAQKFMPEYKGRMMLNGKEISFKQGNKVYDGIVMGVDDDARLIVRLPNGKMKAFGAGEVSLVRESFLGKV